jgi:uncharacterized protein YyaL (SSP411 family)
MDFWTFTINHRLVEAEAEIQRREAEQRQAHTYRQIEREADRDSINGGFMRRSLAALWSFDRPAPSAEPQG